MAWTTNRSWLTFHIGGMGKSGGQWHRVRGANPSGTRSYPDCERRCSRLCAASDETGPSTAEPSNGEDSGKRWRYNSGDGRPKASMEDASWEGVGGPWQFGWQMSERNLVWNDDLKSRLIQRVAAAHAGMSMEEAERALAELAVLLPGIESRLTAMKPEILAGFLSDTAGLAVALITLKGFFPDGDPAQMVVRRPSLALTEELASIGEAAVRLRALLPTVDIDRLVTEHPSMLDVEEFERALAESRRIMPQLDVAKTMATNPALIFGFQRGKQLIPYDEPGSDG